MTKGRLLKTTLLILAIFFCIQGFNIFLSATTLDRMISSSVLSGYRSVVIQLVTTIERGLRFGKPINGFAGMDAYMSNTSGAISGIEQIAIFDTSGALLYSSVPMADKEDYAQVLDEFIERNTTEAAWVDHAGGHYDCHPLQGARNSLQGYLVLKPDQTAIESARAEFLQVNVAIVLALAITVAIAQTGWMSFFMSAVRDRDPQWMQRNIRWLLLIIIGGAQLLYSLPTLYFFQGQLERSAQYKAELLGTPFVRDLEFLVEKNVDLGKIGGIEDHLKTMVQDSPEISGVILEYQGKTVASAGVNNPDESSVSVPLYKSWPDRYTPRAIVGRMTLTGNKQFVTGTIKKLALDLGTTLVICIILLGEMANMFAMLMGVRDVKKTSPAPAVQWDSATLVRGMSFLFFFGYDMVLTFIPLAARNLPGELPGISPAILSSLPLSSEMALAGVGVVIVGALSKRVRWYSLFFVGVVSATLGGVMAWLAPNVLVFILARGLAGLGFGLTLMSAQLGLMGGESHAESIGNMFAGVFAGSLSGCAAGAMVSEHFGYPVVFLTAAILIPLSLVFLPALRNTSTAVAASAASAKTRVVPFLKQPKLWLAMLAVAIPAEACLSGFLFFIVPIQMKSLHIAQGDIGRVFMIYGLCFIYAGPPIGRMLDRTKNILPYLFAGGAFTGMALMLASRAPSLWGYAGSVLLTGISQCILGSALLIYVLQLPAIKEMGSDKAASLLRLLERVGQVAGPIFFAGLLATMEFNLNLLLVGGTIAAAAAVFAVAGKQRPVEETK